MLRLKEMKVTGKNENRKDKGKNWKEGFGQKSERNY